MKTRYEFVRGLKNSGGICAMKVRDRRSGRFLLAKSVSAKAGSLLRKQTEREIDLLQKMKGRGVPVLEETESDLDRIILYESWIQGYSLREWLKKRPSGSRKRKVYRDIVDRIGQVHACGYLYMDLKAEHILVDESDRAWLIDFNAAIPLGSRRAVLSNQLAVPPENGQAKLDFRADLPGLGTIHRLIFGTTDISWICLQNDPEKRFSSLESLKKAADQSGHRMRNLMAAGLFLLTFGAICLFGRFFPDLSGSMTILASEKENRQAAEFLRTFDESSLEQSVLHLLQTEDFENAKWTDDKKKSLLESVLSSGKDSPVAARLAMAKIADFTELLDTEEQIRLEQLAQTGPDSDLIRRWVKEQTEAESQNPAAVCSLLLETGTVLDEELKSLVHQMISQTDRKTETKDCCIIVQYLLFEKSGKPNEMKQSGSSEMRTEKEMRETETTEKRESAELLPDWMSEKLQTDREGAKLLAIWRKSK